LLELGVHAAKYREEQSLISSPRIGLVLGSGSARGWSHIGVIDSLVAAGIEPDIICGTSIGALVGAAYVAGRLADLRQWAEAATWREIIGLIDVRLAGGGLVNGSLIVAWLRGLGITQAIENYPKRYAAVATDLVSGREIWLQSGPIDEAVRASIALPGILSPARIRDKWLVDGGLSNPVPVSVCRALGANVIVAVNLNGDLLGRRFESELGRTEALEPGLVPNEFLSRVLHHLPAGLREQTAQIAQRLLPHGSSTPGYFDVLANSINIMQDHITRTRLAGEPAHVMLIPRLRHIALMEYNRAKEAIAEGCRCVEEALPLLQRHIEDFI
jgi:NTE family protein